jgi:cell wall-associated NlpC family hydrolase
MSLKPTLHRVQGTGVGLAVAFALVVGGLGVHSLRESNATTAGGANIIALEQNAAAPIPFLGPYAHDKPGYRECGPGVRIMEGALRNTVPPIRKGKASNCVGPATVKQLIVFQKRHHIPPSGIYGIRTHRALSHAYTTSQIAGLVYIANQRLTAARYQLIGIITAHAKANAGLMGYCNFGHLAQCSLRGVWPPWSDVPRHTDCSGYVSWVYYQAGLPNPNGVGVGSTKTLVYRGKAVAANAPLKIGDLIFYARNNSHVAIYIGHGLISSHGSAGIRIAPYNYRDIYAIRRYF